MGWEFVALWVDDANTSWCWQWRRIADDSGAVMAESQQFNQLAHCIEDAKQHGFDEDGCGAIG